MSLPTIEDYKAGATTWKGEHKGVGYILSHHGVSDYSPQGTWCYYIFVRENMFIDPTHFGLFDRPAQVQEMGKGSWWKTYDYYDLPDLDFHGGITFYEKEQFFDRRDKQEYTAIKIGCDYAHLWDREGGYWQGRKEVERDCLASIDLLVSQFPVKPRCKYCGKVDMPEMFYETNAGWLVHLSMESQVGDHINWQRKAA